MDEAQLLTRTVSVTLPVHVWQLVDMAASSEVVRPGEIVEWCVWRQLPKIAAMAERLDPEIWATAS